MPDSVWHTMPPERGGEPVLSSFLPLRAKRTGRLSVQLEGQLVPDDANAGKAQLQIGFSCCQQSLLILLLHGCVSVFRQIWSDPIDVAW